MADDFDPTSGDDAGTPDFDLGDGWGKPPAGDAGADKGAKAEPELTVEAALERAYDEKVAGPEDAKAESAWAREHRRLADAAIAAAGVDPNARHELGISRREATRRLYGAEAMLRQDLGQGLSAIVKGYGGTLAPEQRAAAARSVLGAFGFQTPDQIASQERARLQEYDTRAQAEAAAYQRAMPRAQQTLDAFAASHEHFPTVGRTMGYLMTEARESGSPIGLEEAYSRACRGRGLATREDVARNADAERRASVAKARAASTPQTKSAPGRRMADPNAPSRSTEALLESAWDELVGA